MIQNRKIQYLNNCLVQPAVPSIIWGGIFSGVDAFRGQQITVRSIGKVTLEGRQRCSLFSFPVPCSFNFYDTTITVLKKITKTHSILSFIGPITNVFAPQEDT